MIVDRDGGEERSTGDIVVVSCGAANSRQAAAASASDKHPSGLANGSDQVGRNYMFHNNQAVLALSPRRTRPRTRRRWASTTSTSASDDFEYPLGNIQMVGKSQAPMFRGEKPLETKLAPQWTLEKMALHALDFWLCTEDLPKAENRVTIDRDGDLTLSYTKTNAGAEEAALRAAQVDAGAPRPAPAPSDPARSLSQERDGHHRAGAPGGDLPLRQGSEDVGARRQLQGARARQPLRRRHQLLSEHRRREPGASPRSRTRCASATTCSSA